MSPMSAPLRFRAVVIASASVTLLLGMASVAVASGTGAGALDQNESVVISSSPASGTAVKPGDRIVYTIVVSNGRQEPRRGTDLLSRFTMSVPEGTNFVSVNSRGFEFILFINPPEPGGPGPVTFDATTGILAGQFYPNSRITFTLTVEVTATEGTITNQASYTDIDTRTPVVSNIVSNPVAAVP